MNQQTINELELGKFYLVIYNFLQFNLFASKFCDGFINIFYFKILSKSIMIAKNFIIIIFIIDVQWYWSPNCKRIRNIRSRSEESEYWSEENAK